MHNYQHVTRINWIIPLIVVIASLGGITVVQAQNPTITRIATGLHNPRGIAVLPDNRLLVIEAGTGFEPDGTISIFEDVNNDGAYDDEGEITVVVSELPSYNSLDRINSGHDEVFGLSDVVVTSNGRVLFTLDDPFAERESPRSDLFIGNTGIFELDIDDGTVSKFMDSPATLNSIAYYAAINTIYFTESGFNRLGAVTLSGIESVVSEFPFLADGQQAVPSGVAFDPSTGDMLVALFSGHNFDYFGTDLAFQPGVAKIVRVNPLTGEQTDAIIGLTTAIDVAIDEAGNMYVVQLTTQWPTANMPLNFPLDDPDAPPDPGGYVRFSGRVTMYPADGSDPIILAENLDTPTNITYADEALYVSAGLGTPGRSVLGPDGITQITGEIYQITNFK